MGQRLVITVVKDQREVASIYYHWSAYSTSALQEARELIDAMIDDTSDKDFRLKLIRFIESVGGCIDGGKDSKEFIEIQKMFPDETFKESGSRNNGLIALTDEGRESLKSWSEGDLTIDFDNDMVYNSVYNETTLEEYNDWREDDDKVTLEDIPERLDIDIHSIPFGDIENMIGTLGHLDDYEFRHGETIYELIA